MPTPTQTSRAHIREFPADLELRDTAEGMTVSGLVVPYDREAPILELRPDGFIKYREMFVRGAFDRALRAPTRVNLTYNHDVTMAARMGYATSFSESAEGLVGQFRLDHSSADKARDILTSTHACLSVGFLSVVPRADSERAGALVIRRSAILDHVAAVVQGAYPGAAVTTIRAADGDDEPTAADVAAQAQARLDQGLLEWVDQAAQRQQEYVALATGTH